MEDKNITLDDLAVMMKKGFDSIDKRFEETNKKIMQESQKTRDYVDKKNNELKGELVGYNKKILEKVDTLTDALVDKEVISESEKSAIKGISPFPKFQSS